MSVCLSAMGEGVVSNVHLDPSKVAIGCKYFTFEPTEMPTFILGYILVTLWLQICVTTQCRVNWRATESVMIKPN